MPTVVVIVGFLASVLAAIAAVLALSTLRRGITALDDAVSAVHAGDKTSALADLAVARTDFGHSSTTLDAWWSDPAEFVPGVRQHVLALRAASKVGDEVAATGVGLEPDLDTQTTGFGASVLSRLSLLATGLSSANSVLVHAEHQLESVQSGWLLQPVASRLDSALTTVRQAQHDALLGSEGVTAARDLLGGRGAEHLFLAVETEAELRGDGGVLGNYGLLSVDNGQISLVKFGRDSDLDAAGDPATRHLTGLSSYVSLYSNLSPQLYWQNVLASPDFPMDAEAVEQLYPQSGGTKVNGVIAVDPAGLAALLAITGPVSVPSWPVPLTSTNATDILLHQQYDVLSGDARVEFLGEVAAAAWGRLSSTKLPGLSTLASVLGSAIAEKHLMFASTDPATEAALTALGASGSMTRPANSDFLAVTNENASGNKIDYYLRRSVNYNVSIDPTTRTLSGDVVVKLQNLAPASGQPAYVIGSVNNPLAPLGVNETYLSIYTPWDYAAAAVDGRTKALESAQASGLNVYSTYLSIPPGGTTTLTLKVSGTLSTTSSYRLELFRQPTTTPDNVVINVKTPSGWDLQDPSRGLTSSGSTAKASLQTETNEYFAVGVTKQ